MRPTEATTANQTFSDGVNDILFSRRPLGDYDQLVRDRQKSAGDKIRQDTRSGSINSKR
jgi:hypothetical protein